MIQNRKDLQEYLKRDNGGWGQKSFWYRFVKKIGGSENYHIKEFFRILRYYEYYQHGGILSVYWKLRYNHYRTKAQLFVAPNTIGAGVTLVHPGFLRVDNWVSIGKNCTILFGKRRSMDENNNDVRILVGDNCYISTGVIILGPVVIGNNVIIGAGAVVNKDIPDNCVVAGVPAKVIAM